MVQCYRSPQRKHFCTWTSSEHVDENLSQLKSSLQVHPAAQADPETHNPNRNAVPRQVAVVALRATRANATLSFKEPSLRRGERVESPPGVDAGGYMCR